MKIDWLVLTILQPYQKLYKKKAIIQNKKKLFFSRDAQTWQPFFNDGWGQSWEYTIEDGSEKKNGQPYKFFSYFLNQIIESFNQFCCSPSVC